MGKIQNFPVISKEEQEQIMRTLDNIKIDTDVRMMRETCYMTHSDAIGKNLYDDIMKKLFREEWLSYIELKKYLNKILYFLRQEKNMENNLYIARQRIGYTVLVDQIGSKILNLSDELSHQLLSAFLEQEVSYTQYKTYATILTDDRVLKKLNTLTSDEMLPFYLEDIMESIEPVKDQEVQVVNVVKELEEKIKNRNQKTLLDQLQEQETFTISALAAALSQQIQYRNQYFPNLQNDQDDHMISTILYLEHLSTSLKMEYLQTVKQILNEPVGLSKKLEQIQKITNYYYHQFHQSKIIFPNFSSKKGSK